MAVGPEAEIEDPVVITAEAHGFYVRKVKWEGRNGAPDRLFAHRRRKPGGCFIEFKAPGEPVPTHQSREHSAMRAEGFEVHVCDSIEQALMILGLWPCRILYRR